MQTLKSSLGKLIHVGKLLLPGKGYCYVLLRMEDPSRFAWVLLNSDFSEEETEISAPNPEEAIRLANKNWKTFFFRPVNCGFRYTLPERDEHGINALFWQMAASAAQGSGVYFDESCGNNCFVQFASDEALNLLADFKREGKL